MLSGFFDTSGTHVGSKMRSLCGLVGDHVAFEDFDRRWKAVLDKPDWPNRPKELHTANCAHGEGDFVGWPFAKRLALVGQLVDVLIDSKDLVAVGSGALVSIFDCFSTHDLDLLKSERLGTPVDLVFQSCMQRIAHVVGTRWSGERAAIIFDYDSGPEGLVYLEHFTYYASSLQFGPFLGAAAFGDSVELTPLQAADLLAYGTYQWATKETMGFDVEPYFPTVPVFLRMIEGVAADGGIYEQAALQKLLIGVKARRTLPEKTYEGFHHPQRDEFVP